MATPFVTVLVPAYNEEAIIERSLTEIVAFLESIEHKYTWELVVVNDGSADRTGEILDRLAGELPNLNVLHHKKNYNLGQALRFGFNNACGDYIVVLDADLSYSPDHVERLVDAAVDTGAKIVIASPYAEGGRTTAIPRFRETLSRGANRLLGTTAQGQLSTVTGMVRCYDRRFIQSMSLKAWDVEINTEIIYKAQLMRARIVEIPAHLDWTEQLKVSDTRGSSIRVLRGIAAQMFSSFLFRPFAYFIVPGLIVLLLALWTLGWVVYHVASNWGDAAGTVDGGLSAAIAAAFQVSPHSFIVGGLAFIIAVQLLTLGVVTAQNKRYFEEVFFLGTSLYREVHMPDVFSADAKMRRDGKPGSMVEPPSPGGESAGGRAGAES
jgi:glycosyltransferase involved in cell wall biosynthesis